MTVWRRFPQAAALALLLIIPAAVLAEVPANFDARVLEAMRTHDVPGMAISIVQDGKVVHARGYGVRMFGGSEPVDADTIFPTGSTGKAVTAAALAILVDEGKLGWDDKVIDHLPDFRMHDPWVTREMTVRDLLIHRSGLGLGAGDLLFIPRTSRSRADIVRALRHIKPATSFRSGYAYDNILYIVAGEVVASASGQSWESFVRERIFKPLGMRTAVSDEADRFATANRAQPHARLDPRLRGLGKQQVLPEREGLGQVGAAAGGLSWSANDAARWLQVQLALGASPEGKRVWSEASARAMWTPQVPIAIQPYPTPITDITPQFSNYALGWNVQDYRGVKVVQHGGAVFGVLAFVVLVPERNLGISLMMNAEDVGVMRGLGYELLDHALGMEPRDWVAAFDAWNKQRLAGGLAALEAVGTQARKDSRPSLPLSGYAGRYVDAWYGSIVVDTRAGALRMDFTHTPNMAGTLRHWQYDTFRVDWEDASLEPAYATFALDAEGKVARITMKAVSPLADFSYDYHDLLFTPMAAKP
ncbi:serine hydrolase [Thermomonas carbonis]|uniref:Serine hydrolase n=1 Tax=Thermomonas carbonis TaxID=1463158 RepID=A0A7G9SLS2_9GAMM|nr:serine hydrolase [Thermomonas carbonis]QNN68797.1 serine hydrolase [Thermomonas carbonis]GHC08699.1 serine hydrolase [Thermomonas carbonis]